MLYDSKKMNCFEVLQAIQSNSLLLNKISASYKMLILLDKAKREYATNNYISCDSVLDQLVDLVCK
jgi:hypothetical protein